MTCSIPHLNIHIFVKEVVFSEFSVFFSLFFCFFSFKFVFVSTKKEELMANTWNIYGKPVENKRSGSLFFHRECLCFMLDEALFHCFHMLYYDYEVLSLYISSSFYSRKVEHP